MNLASPYINLSTIETCHMLIFSKTVSVTVSFLPDYPGVRIRRCSLVVHKQPFWQRTADRRWDEVPEEF